MNCSGCIYARDIVDGFPEYFRPDDEVVFCEYLGEPVVVDDEFCPYRPGVP